jgi:hypothetical protein
VKLEAHEDLRHFLWPQDADKRDADSSATKPATREPKVTPSTSSRDVGELTKVSLPELSDPKTRDASAGADAASTYSMAGTQGEDSNKAAAGAGRTKPGARPTLWLQNQSIANHLIVCPGRPGKECGSIDVISKGEGRWQCKRCGYKFRPKSTDLSPDAVVVIEIFFDSGGSRAATVRNCKRVGIDITECQVDNILIKTAANTKRTIDVMKEAGVTTGILLLDGTHHKLRAGELPQLIALDLKSKLVINDAFVEETYNNTLPFVRELKENGYKVDPYAIIDNSGPWYRATREVYSCDIQICVVHEQRNVLESGLPADENCSDLQLAVKKLGTSILFVGGHSIRSYKKALEKAKKYRERLRAMLSRVDQATGSVVSSLLRNFNDITTHLRHRSPHRDTNLIENTIRLIRKPVRAALRQYENRELVKAILKLAVMRYEASVLGIRGWVRWSQKNPN